MYLRRYRRLVPTVGELRPTPHNRQPSAPAPARPPRSALRAPRPGRCPPLRPVVDATAFCESSPMEALRAVGLEGLHGDRDTGKVCIWSRS